VTWFKGLGYEVPEGVNPADHFISIAEDEGSEGSKERVKHLLDSWAEEKQRSSGDSTPVPREYAKGQPEEKTGGKRLTQNYPTTAAKEFSILLTRWWWEQVSRPYTVSASDSYV
jgi:hypothetical protein